jgi:hypothetical protein
MKLKRSKIQFKVINMLKSYLELRKQKMNKYADIDYNRNNELKLKILNVIRLRVQKQKAI